MPLYLMPITGAGTNADPRGPKYLTQIRAAGVSWQMADFGAEPVCLIWIDATPALDTTITALADVVRIPDNLDVRVTAGQVTAVTNWLEARNFPAGWLNTTYTVRVALRTILGGFLFWQRFSHEAGINRIAFGAVTLSTQFNQLTANTRAALIATASGFGYDTSSLSGTSTLRQILKVMADQWRGGTISVGPLAI